MKLNLYWESNYEKDETVLVSPDEKRTVMIEAAYQRRLEETEDKDSVEWSDPQDILDEGINKPYYNSHYKESCQHVALSTYNYCAEAVEGKKQWENLTGKEDGLEKARQCECPMLAQLRIVILQYRVTSRPETAKREWLRGINKVGGLDSDNPVSSDRDVQNISDVLGWLGEINPNYNENDPESPYCNNCGSCAYAVYQRLEGNTDSYASAKNIGYNSEMNSLTGMKQVSMSPWKIKQRLLKQGNGAHAIIGIDREEGPGHWFNAACLDGRVVAIDGQTGTITDWPPDYGNVVNWEMSVHEV